MISKYFSSMWTTVAPALGNHLWQSTLVAIFTAFLAFALRKNHAAARYRLWLLASLKFLFPFSLLIGIGSHLTWSRGIVRTAAGFDVALGQVSQPFTQATSTLSLATPPPASQILNNLFPVILTVVWLCGFAVVLSIWYMRWRKISLIVKIAKPILEGREVETLRRLERIQGISSQIEVLLSHDSLEPGIFGIVRPVLVWPEGISGRLEDAHLEAIITHELCHVRRRDNLAAAIHMLIETVFWFHPLVWWLGARLVEERERACDEAVLKSGSSAHVYAESILKICEFCVGSPLTCVSGVTGADLKKRIANIVGERIGHKLDFSRRLLLSTAALLAIATPVTIGLLHSIPSRAASPNTQSMSGPSSAFDWQSAAGSKQSFKFATVKRNTSGSDSSSMNIAIGPGDAYSPTGGHFIAKNVPLVSYIYFAYKLTGSQLQLLVPHLPQWILKNRYDIEARSDGDPSKDQVRLMMQSLLEGWFKLEIRRETEQLPVFVLVMENPEKTGPQLRSHIDDPACSVTLSASNPASDKAEGTIAGGYPLPCGGITGLPSTAAGRLRAGARNVSVQLLATTLAQMGNFDRPVIDQTGLRGTFDFTLEWTPQLNRPLPSGVNSPMDEPSADFLQDLKQQLGLRLTQQTAPVEILFIDHAEQPSEN